LTIANSTGFSGPYVPWKLIEIDKQQNRIYLSATGADCVVPTSVQVQESSTTIILAVRGVEQQEPCTAESRSLIGYIVPTEPIASKRVQRLGD
jgi:hypothetical protein